MDSEELVIIEPLELRFAFEPRKQISSSFQLLNKSDKHLAFKVKTTNPKKYSVKPSNGVVLPRSTCDVIVTMQAQKEAPPDMQCKDRFLVQSVLTEPGLTPKDFTTDIFDKEAGNHVQEWKLKVVFTSPPRPPSPVPEESEEGASPGASESGNGDANDSRDQNGLQQSAIKGRAMILKLTEERDSIVQQNNKLRQQLELMKQESKRTSPGVPLIFVLLVALLGVLLGYLLRRPSSNVN